MAYSEKAKSLRRCEAIKPDGERCRNYSRLDSNVCVIHLYPKRKRAVIGRHEPILVFIKRKGKAHHVRQRHKTCNCAAYLFPHRAGGGLCRWPDPPIFRLATSAGTHSGIGSLKTKLRKDAPNGFTRAINYERNGEVKVIPENLSETERRALLAIAAAQRSERGEDLPVTIETITLTMEEAKNFPTEWLSKEGF
jgi:hypothetical protein